MNVDSNFSNRINELANRSFQSNTYTFTDFLGIAEQSDLLMMERSLDFVGFELFGGYSNADRRIARFGREDSLGFSEDYPISCLHITPLMKKFSDDLNHRDFLGAIMNLGIERDVIGDIKVCENEAYVFCLTRVAEYISDSLDRVKHTSMKVDIVTDVKDIDKIFVTSIPDSKQIVVSSLRLDAIISKVYNLSRNDSLKLFQGQKIYLNGRLNENNSMAVKSGDVVNARGYGKFKIDTDGRETRKGRISLNVLVW